MTPLFPQSKAAERIEKVNAKYAGLKCVKCKTRDMNGLDQLCPVCREAGIRGMSEDATVSVAHFRIKDERTN